MIRSIAITKAKGYHHCVPSSHSFPWIVRAIWEEHVGWFRYESTTELYDTPPAAVWRDIVELTGGTTALIGRADSHIEHGRVLHALHLIDIVLAHAPDDPAALRVKRHALESLLESSGGRENFSEVQWLEHAIKTAGTPETEEDQ